MRRRWAVGVLWGLLPIAFVLALGADRRDAQQIEQLVDEALPVRFDILFYLIHFLGLLGGGALRDSRCSAPFGPPPLSTGET